SPRSASPPGLAFTLKCLKEKRVPIGVTVVVAALLLAVIALAGKRSGRPPPKSPPPLCNPHGERHHDVPSLSPAKKCPSCPSCPSPTSPPCLESGIGYGEKCFYFVEEAAEWRRSQSSCLALGARLTTVDTREELRFLVRYGSPGQYWVGLRRESSGVWRWINGSLFNN
ncbi:CLC2E protein, partial [Podargus strigoides]|nr:CLC2E protein [Podargus strigoides]